MHIFQKRIKGKFVFLNKISFWQAKFQTLRISSGSHLPPTEQISKKPRGNKARVYNPNSLVAQLAFWRQCCWWRQIFPSREGEAGCQQRWRQENRLDQVHSILHEFSTQVKWTWLAWTWTFQICTLCHLHMKLETK